MTRREIRAWLMDMDVELEAILVLTGVTSRANAERHAYRPSRIVESVAELVDELG